MFNQVPWPIRLMLAVVIATLFILVMMEEALGEERYQWQLDYDMRESYIQIQETFYLDAVAEVIFHNEDLHPHITETIEVNMRGIIVQCTLVINVIQTADRLSCSPNQGYRMEPSTLIVNEGETVRMFVFPEQLLLF